MSPQPISSSQVIVHKEDMEIWAKTINQALQRFSDKDWNYSRILVTVCPLNEVSSPYVLWIDWLDMRGKQAQAAFKTIQQEVTWGGRHSHELGILEIISLRLNHA